MTFTGTRTKFSYQNTIGFYLFFSVASSGAGLLYFLSQKNGVHLLLDQYCFFAAFSFINYWMWSEFSGRVVQLLEGPLFGSFLSFQFFSLLGLSQHIQSIEPVYLSIMPLIAGLYLFNSKKMIHSESKIKKTLGLCLAAYLSIFSAWVGVKSSTNQALAFLTVFFVWQIGVVYFTNLAWFKGATNFLQNLLKTKGKETLVQDGLKERYFFHDLINSTHGLILFLGQRINNGRAMTSEETFSLLNEIKTLQSLIKDHYGYGHKDLPQSYEWVSFEFAKNSLYNLIKQYLPEHETEISFLFKGLVQEDKPFEQRNACQVHYPSLYRIVNNLVKNMREADAKVAEFIFDYQKDGLHLIVKNQIFKLSGQGEHLAKDLSNIILDYEESSSSSGMGLESVGSLCEMLGGSFHFQIRDGFWESHIYLPAPHFDDLEQKDAA